MKKNIFTLFLITILATVLASCSLLDGNPKEGPPPTSTAMPEETVPITAPPITMEFPACAGGGESLTPGIDQEKYKEGDHYNVPIHALITMAEPKTFIVFEGETRANIHTIRVVNVRSDYFQYIQGSFWAYCPQDYLSLQIVDDLLMRFASDKWKNWESQDQAFNPIEIQLTSKLVYVPAGVKPTLTLTQKIKVAVNDAGRCPSDQPLEETPTSEIQSDGSVVGALGSSSCRTLLIARLNGKENIGAYWFYGARDNVHYWPTSAHVYLLPDAWGQNDIQSWVDQNFPGSNIEKLN